MPIGEMGDYKSSHWDQVREQVELAVTSASMRPIPVWKGEAGSVIPHQIFRNLLDLPFCVAVVSGWNHNVMLELGARIAFDMPVVIVADDETRFAFDIQAVSHIKYPRTLTWRDMERFRQELKDALQSEVASHRLTGSQDHVRKKTILQAFGVVRPPVVRPDSEPARELALGESLLSAINLRLANIESRLLPNGEGVLYKHQANWRALAFAAMNPDESRRKILYAMITWPRENIQRVANGSLLDLFIATRKLSTALNVSEESFDRKELMDIARILLTELPPNEAEDTSSVRIT